MQFHIQGNPDVGDLIVGLDAGESIWAESGAMSRMSGDTEVSAKLVGGFFKAIARKLVGGESLIVGQYTSPNGGAVAFSPSIPGTILHQQLQGNSINLTAGSFLACSPGMELKTRFGGLKAFFSGEGGFFIECTGEGDLFFNSYGAVLEKTIDGELIVDTGHLVAWEPTLSYKIRGMGGIKQTLFSGERLVMHFSGQGKIWLQTRHLTGVVGWLSPIC